VSFLIEPYALGADLVVSGRWSADARRAIEDWLTG